MNKSTDLTCADALIKTITEYWGVDTSFWYVGWAAIPLFNSLEKFNKKIKFILPASEQWAWFMSQWYTRSTWKLALSIVTSWPWFTNIITPMADANMDSIAMLVVSGQVPTDMIWKDAFQEVDAIHLSEKITKYNIFLKDPTSIVEETIKALDIALWWRPWVVHIDISKDIQLTPYTWEFVYPEKTTYNLSNFEHKKNNEISQEKLTELKNMIDHSDRPVLIVWQWIKFWWAEKELLDFINKLGIPTVYTALWKWVVDDDNENVHWMLWMHWFYHANIAVDNADLIINIWSRFDDRIVWTYSDFWKNAYVVHIDIDDKEIWKLVSINLWIRSDCKDFFDAFSSYTLEKLNIDSWRAKIQKLKIEKPYEIPEDVFWTKQVLKDIWNSVKIHSDLETIYWVDVWQHQMWASQILDIKNSKNWLFSWWLWTMWFSLPSSIWAAIANPKKQVISISWDWWFQMNLSELTVLLEQYPNMNIKVVIIDNGFLWMVRQWQDMFDENTRNNVNIASPNYLKIAEAYWIKWYKVSSLQEMKDMHKVIYSSNWPAIIWYKVKPEENVFPMVPSWKPLWETITS